MVRLSGSSPTAKAAPTRCCAARYSASEPVGCSCQVTTYSIAPSPSYASSGGNAPGGRHRRRTTPLPAGRPPTRRGRPPAAAAPAAGWGMSSPRDRPILLLDVDGVLNAARVDLPEGWERGTFNGYVLSWNPTITTRLDRKSTRLNSSHANISYA